MRWEIANVLTGWVPKIFDSFSFGRNWLRLCWDVRLFETMYCHTAFVSVVLVPSSKPVTAYNSELQWTILLLKNLRLRLASPSCLNKSIWLKTHSTYFSAGFLCMYLMILRDFKNVTWDLRVELVDHSADSRSAVPDQAPHVVDCVRQHFLGHSGRFLIFCRSVNFNKAIFKRLVLNTYNRIN